MRIVSFDIQGAVYYELVPQGQTVNKDYNIDTLRRLQKNLRRNGTVKWNSGDWFLHHNNAPAHSALPMHVFLTKSNMTVVPYPPYSPDLAPCVFFVFPKRNMALKEGDLRMSI
jgi:hypothetical protein